MKTRPKIEKGLKLSTPSRDSKPLRGFEAALLLAIMLVLLSGCAESLEMSTFSMVRYEQRVATSDSLAKRSLEDLKSIRRNHRELEQLIAELQENAELSERHAAQCEANARTYGIAIAPQPKLSGLK